MRRCQQAAWLERQCLHAVSPTARRIAAMHTRDTDDRPTRFLDTSPGKAGPAETSRPSPSSKESEWGKCLRERRLSSFTSRKSHMHERHNGFTVKIALQPAIKGHGLAYRTIRATKPSSLG